MPAPPKHRLRVAPLKLDIKRVKKVLANGSIKVYLYHRVTGAALDPHNLIQSYAEADRKKRVVGAPTFNDLIRRWETSPEYDALSESTKADWAWRLPRIRERWGSCPVETFNNLDDAEEFRRDALSWHDAVAVESGRRAADALMAGVARVLSFNRAKVQIKFNPLTRFKRHYTGDRSEITWSDGLIGRFLESASPPMRTAMMLVRNLGQRQKDIRELPWAAYDGTTIEVWPSKGRKKKPIRVKCPLELKGYLDGLPRTGDLVLHTTTGRPFTANYFGKEWRADADKVGAGGLHFHDLRGTAATRLAEAGCTAPEIASVLGWSIKRAQQTIDKYIARSGKLAAAAIDKLDRSRNVLRTEMETEVETGNAQVDK